MKILHTHKAVQPAVRAKTLFQLERSGKYEEGLAEIKDIWADPATFPSVEEFSPRDAAEILLRCGSLYGFFGHIKQLPDAQETSKNLLTEARGRFQDIYDVEKIAECENYLALAYWRTGEYNEATAWIDETLSHNLPNSNNTRLHSYIVLCLINLALKKYEENLRNLTRLETHFLNCTDDCLKGDFHGHRGIAYRNLSDPVKALRQYELARYHYQKAKNKIYLATVENNLAYLHKAEKRFSRAHESIDSAIQLFRQTKDRTREGFAFDSKALIYFDESRFDLALPAIDKGISILKKSENTGFLAEAYLTRSRILIYLDDFTAGTFALIEAVNIARTQTDEKAAARFVRDFEETLNAKRASQPRSAQPPIITAKDNLKLVLPPALAHYTEYQGIWINNTHLESVGLRQGCLAVIVKDAVNKGDLAAVAEKETEEISCGFYDREFGIICLEGPGSDPLLFDEDQVVLLGKIVGFCDPAKETGGKMMVEEIKF